MEVFENSPLFHPMPNGDIQCLCCQHTCVIPPGKLGRCRARGNVNGKPYSPIWGRYTTAVDPVEKKPLYHFLPGSKVYSYGTVGCNFNCQFCQNSSLSMWKLDIEDVKCLKANDVGVLDLYSPEQMVKEAIRTGCKSIASTYNEPTVSSEFSHEVFKLAKSKGLYTIYVTNGFESVETLNYLGPYLDAVNIDLKAFSEDFYVRTLGGHLEGVCKTIKRCHAMGILTEVTTLVIPDANDSDKELTDIANFLASVSKDIVWHISAYHDDYHFQGRGRTPLATLKRAAAIGAKAGLKYVYMGNVSTDEGGLTKCPKCGNKLIQRGWFDATVSRDFVNGRCKCGETIPGVFVGGINLNPKINSVPANLLDEPTGMSIAQSSGDNSSFPKDFVVFASKGGTSKMLAEKIGERIGFNNIVDIATLSSEQLHQASRVVFVVSTYGRGMPAPSANEFWTKLSSDSQKLDGLQFAVLGCGSSSFEGTFAAFAKNLEQRLNEMGAKEVIPLCTRDEMEDDDDEKVDGWIGQIKFAVRYTKK
ncbi:flavodoxin family protein [Tritrichomonas foetus]|uniref:tRNA 4-demethylwyosine synthase (AdoMet-dependent) n=1 Tax=Tritrichomonas foetus TaxID=1144522 RepID=A0A1J4J6C6_9EUKA|nr:flavodoxin family protein [Tritrichomonas foetus]|eukprot:OHS93219.1 flavodoxin family protein [Tritrichomonas foetus]